VSLFRRLAVAYGLSFDRFQMGEIMPPGDISDVPRPSKKGLPRMVTKDGV
jgi:hypothetical protein